MPPTTSAHSVALSSLPVSSSIGLSSKVTHYTESACCKSMFHVFQLFQRYVVNVLYRCCKSRSGCCICCNSCTLML
jgi:hypothetical protein